MMSRHHGPGYIIWITAKVLVQKVFQQEKSGEEERKEPATINENHARELMELHTYRLKQATPKKMYSASLYHDRMGTSLE